MKKRLFAAVLLLLLLVGCKYANVTNAPDKETEKQKTESVKTEEKTPDNTVTIVRPERTTAAVRDAVEALENKLKALGLSVKTELDTALRGKDVDRFPNEICVGPTNRPESAALYARMDEAEEPYDYLVTLGPENGNCVGALDECMADAVEAFADEYARRLVTGAAGESTELERRHEFARRLSVGGKTYVRMRIETNGSDPEKYAASELKKYLNEIGIFDGNGLLFKLSIEFSLPTDGYSVEIGEDDTVRIRGGNGRGVIYGVYAFLERCAGVRYFMPGLETLGEGDIVLAENFSHTPIFEMRQSDWQCGNSDVTWCVKQGINQREIPRDKGGNIKYGGFVHTMASLSETSSEKQPCLSDPKVLETVIKNVRAMLDRDPNITIVSVSQNDNQKYCSCAACSAVDKEEGSHAGTLLRFVNAVADAIADDYPDVIIDTLAYQYTRTPPKITKPLPNVCIRLCSIECCFSHPLNDPSCKTNTQFVNDILAWNEVCDRIYIWDYVTDFCFYIPTFPNFGVLRQNMRFFAEHGVKGMYPEGNYNSKQSGEFGELRCYLLAKLMMDPMMSEEEYYAHMDEFLAAYYGEGWEGIRAYIDWTTAEASKRHMDIWNPPTSVIPIRDWRAMEETFDGHWDKAEELAGDRLEAVQRSRLQWQCIKLMLHPDEEEAARFLDEIQRLKIKWRETSDLPTVYDLKKSPATWK